MTAQLVDPPLDGDPVLLSRVRAGDPDAYALLFERHRQVAVAFAGRLAGASHADDLVAEAFAKVLDALQRDLGPRVSFRSYLLTSIRSIWVNTVRSERRYDLVDDYEALSPVAALQVTDDPDRRFDNHAVAEAYRTLPERWQAVLWYTAVEGLPHSEVALHLGIKANAVAALSFRAREGLRQAYLAAHLGTALDPACQVWGPLLPSYARGSLDKRKRSALEAHLDDCLTCTAALADLDEVNNRLGALLVPVVLGPGLVGLPGLWSGSGAGAGTAAVSSGAASGKAGAVVAASKVGLLATVVATVVGVAVALPLVLDRSAVDRLTAVPGPASSPASAGTVEFHGPVSVPERAGDRPRRRVTRPAADERPGRARDGAQETPGGSVPGPRAAELDAQAESGPSLLPDAPTAPVPDVTTLPSETTDPPDLTVLSPDAGLGVVTVTPVVVAGVTFAHVQIPVRNLRPGAVVTVEVTDLLAHPWLQSAGWSCPGTVDGALDPADLVPTTSVSCTWTGVEVREGSLAFHLLTQGGSELTASIAQTADVVDPVVENNTTSAAIAP